MLYFDLIYRSCYFLSPQVNGFAGLFDWISILLYNYISEHEYCSGPWLPKLNLRSFPAVKSVYICLNQLIKTELENNKMHLKIPDAVYYTRKTMPWNIQVNGNVMFYKEKNKLNGKKTKSCFSFWVARLFLI